jgi:hypothetical protein
MYCHSALLLLLLLLEVLVYTITVGQKKRTDDIYAMTLKNKNNKNSQKNSEERKISKIRSAQATGTHLFEEQNVSRMDAKFWGGGGGQRKGTLLNYATFQVFVRPIACTSEIFARPMKTQFKNRSKQDLLAQEIVVEQLSN